MGLIGGGGLALGLPVVRVGMWWNRKPGDGLQALSRREYEVVEAMAEAMFPPGGIVPESGKELNCAAFVDLQMAAMGIDLLRVLKAGIHMIDDVSIFSDGSLTPFRKRSIEDRERILLEWEESPAFPQRGILRLFKWYIGMGFFEHPGVHEAMGVDFMCNG
jgi:hypothetical protein